MSSLAPQTASESLKSLWHSAGLPEAALNNVHVPGNHPVFPSSFRVADAAQSSLGAAAGAANLLYTHRTSQEQAVYVDRTHVCLECTCTFALDDFVPPTWDPLSGLYRCREGWVRIHANFAHHRDRALEVLGLLGESASRKDVESALLQWSSVDFEEAATKAGAVVSAARTFAQWDAHPQAKVIQQMPVVRLTRLDKSSPAKPRAWPSLGAAQRPLEGIRVVELTRILAGPVAGRLLAAYGAQVMLVNGPHLPNIDAVAETSRGKLSCHADLRTEQGRAQLDKLTSEAHVFLQGYRPGATAFEAEQKSSSSSFSPEALAERHPGIVVGSLSAYGGEGPWGHKRGFDSIVQTATGFNLAEAEAAQGSETVDTSELQPKPMPMQILDYSAGHLLAFGLQAALFKQATEGGSWLVEVSLAGVGNWLRGMGRLPDGLKLPVVNHRKNLSLEPYMETAACAFSKKPSSDARDTPVALGSFPPCPTQLRYVRHAAHFAGTPARFDKPSVPPGTHMPQWPDQGKKDVPASSL